MGHVGMQYSLPSRDLIADCVESVAAAHQLDGIVLLSNCDKITPGMIIGALRLNIPAIIVTAGPMLDGECQHHHKLTMVTGSFEAVGKYRKGEITEEELLNRIDELNKDKNIHGILVQMPLPNHLNSKIIQNRI